MIMYKCGCAVDEDDVLECPVHSEGIKTEPKPKKAGKKSAKEKVEEKAEESPPKEE